MKISEAMKKVSSWLCEHRIPMSQDEKSGLIAGFISNTNTEDPVRFVIDFRDELTIGYAIWKLQEGVDNSRISELIVRINFTLLRGCFELDGRAGFLRYKYVVLNHTIQYGNSDAIGEVAMLPCVMMARYKPYFQKVINGEPIDAVLAQLER